ncbi:Chromate resistance protein ChrB [Calorimonas adulescens]|uniref:ChrB N-terminal domain-containing protein n=1 Tax=Calorimonas adulescens TaxID=2606906 RepID=A0A5D8Q9E2_9THEO|nr:Chromate resistance protein ChrB [Calorimonas adulescens]MDI6601333.1 hypothetical protein [Thermoanaerobacteraceae bacterium]TZE80729.1 hypothetical protein FWJ32_12295 [Calorimonas adulescens]
MRWLLFIYKVPAEPSTARVNIWKKIKELGAVSLQQSVYILPDDQSVRPGLEALKKQIAGYAGDAKILTTDTLDVEQEKEIIESFIKGIEKEYDEIIEECGAFFREIEKETERDNLSYAEFEENEKRLSHLKEWYEGVKKRDYFGSDKGRKVDVLIKQCEEALYDFERSVISREESGGDGTYKMDRFTSGQAVDILNDVIEKIEKGKDMGFFVTTVKDGYRYIYLSIKEG